MKTIINLLLLLTIAGCTPVEEDYSKNEIWVIWKPSTTAELLKSCGAHAKGCSKFSKSSNTCFVYSKEPKYIDDNATEMLGHEVLHCFRGFYHGKFGERVIAR